MKKMSDSTKLFLSVIILFVLIIYSYQKSSTNQKYDPFKIEFQSINGKKNLNQFKNKIILLYFGFLTCPEACPTTMSNVSAAFKQLSPDELSKITMIFVDLDPERDSLPKMIEYVQYFHPHIIPFQADLKTLDPFTKYFGIAFVKVPLKSHMGYTIDHSTDIKVLSPTGEFLNDIHHGTNSKLMLTIFKELIRDHLKR